MNPKNYYSGIPDIPDKNILVFGCGNILFGDDGFGPRVAEELLKNNLFYRTIYEHQTATKQN